MPNRPALSARLSLARECDRSAFHGRYSHLLLVDDERSIREPLAQYLTKQGFRVTQAGDAEGARARMAAYAIDLVVLDIMMPGEDGLSLCRHIRETSDTPVILLTARAEETDRIVGLEMGADDYVVKPFSRANWRRGSRWCCGAWPPVACASMRRKAAPSPLPAGC